MRALIVSHAAVKSSNRRVYRQLVDRGIDVTLIVPDRWKAGLGHVQAEPEPRDSKLRVVVCRRGGISHSNVYWLRSFDRLAREANPEAIYVDEDAAGFAAGQAARFVENRRIGLVVCNIQNIFKRYPLPFEAVQRYVFERAHAAVCCSDQAADVLRRRGFSGELRKMPFSTDLSPLSADERSHVRAEVGINTAVVGYVGRLVPEKGVDDFLRAVAMLPGVPALIVGNGPERNSLERLVTQLNIKDRVRFLGTQTPGRTAQLLGALDVLALPSRTRPNWAEQFGRVLIEAMALGVPVVASDSGAIAEVVGDAGILVAENDPNSLAEGLKRALDRSAARDLRQRGIDRAAAMFTGAVETSALMDALLIAAARAS